MKSEMPFDPDKQILQQAAAFKPPFVRSTDEAWMALRQRIEAAGPGQKEAGPTRFWAMAAAIVVLVAAGGLMYFLAEVKVTTPNMRRATAMLPDGSEVVLHANTTLSYNRLTWSFWRRVNLSGEGWFEVKRGEKFKVVTEAGEVEVLGTSFDVLAADTLLRVYCETGKVRVSNRYGSAVLQPGEITYCSADGFHTSQAEYAPNFWVQGTVLFDNAPLAMVLAHIEQEFGLEIKTKTNLNRHFSGLIPGDSAEAALDIICAPYGLNWSKTQSDGQAVVTIE